VVLSVELHPLYSCACILFSLKLKLQREREREREKGVNEGIERERERDFSDIEWRNIMSVVIKEESVVGTMRKGTNATCARETCR